MRKYLFFLCLLIATGLRAQSADTLYVLHMPQYTNPFYEPYSLNYLGVEAAGRGYTGTGVLGSAQTALINPATMITDSTRIFTEINIKPSISAEGLAFDSRYSSPMPLGLLGLSFPLGSKVAAAIIYSNPKSLVLDDFSVVINQGADMVTRYPKYYLHQLTVSARYQATDDLNVGLSVHNQLHYLDDVIFLMTYDRVRDYKYLLRFQPGLYYQVGDLGVGLSATIPSKIKWDLDYAEYDADLPLELSAGLSYSKDIYRFSSDFRFRQDSAIDDVFEDKISLHLGAERREGNKIIRAGYFYSSDVFNGQVMLPVDENSLDESIFWEDVSPTLPVDDNEQHFLTVGFGYLFRDGSLNLSAMGVVAGESKCTQVNLSLSLYISSFKRKDFLKFE
nr:hypothetical protein [Candidatus Cloacimonadota bacterium]